MASTNKTPNLNLPQWEATDKPERTDFNAAFDAIDDTIGSQTYTEQNYVTDSESFTASIDALDIQLKDSFNVTDILSSLTMMPGYSINTTASSLIVFDRFLIFSIGVAKAGNHTVGAAQFATLPLAYSPVKTKAGSGIVGSGALVSNNVQWTIGAKTEPGSSFNVLVESTGLSTVYLSGIVYLDG